MFSLLIQEVGKGMTSLHDFDECPDIADDVFLLATRGINYCPRLVFTRQLLPPLLDMVVTGVLVHHRRALKRMGLSVPRSRDVEGFGWFSQVVYS